MGPDIRGLLLCGGRATRFGADKLLATIEVASVRAPLVAHAARNLITGVGNAVAVLPLGASELRAALAKEGCEILETDRTSAGMGSSLAAAVESADSADGWIVALGDMPLIRPATFHAVKEALASGAAIAAAVERASGRRGHPVGFSAAMRAELVALRGDVGARDILTRHAREIVAVPTDDPAIFVDIDTVQDLARLLSAG